MKPVFVVTHEPSVPPGSVAEVLEASDTDHVIFEAWRETTWPTAAEIEALVVMGGAMNVDELEAYPFLSASRQLMADAVERDVPTLGVCLGSQMLARVLGAEVRRASPRNALFSPLELTPEGANDPLLAPFGDGVAVLQFHEDTFELPEGVIALATSASTGLGQAFRYGRAYAVQFHFEVDEAIVRGWTRNIGRRAMLDEWGVSEDDLLKEADVHLGPQGRAGRELVTRFLETTTGAE